MDVETTIHKSATLTIQFDKLHEAQSLYEELTRWTAASPSDNMQQFLQALLNIAQDN